MLRIIITLLITGSTIAGCSGDKKPQNKDNTYYIELVDITDNLDKYIRNGLSGKVSFYVGDNLKIAPETMINELKPEMHYYRLYETLGKDIPEGTWKIRIALKGNNVKDSTTYAYPRYRYVKGKWSLVSDIGFRPVDTKIVDSTNHYRPDFIGKEIINNVVNSTYDR